MGKIADPNLPPLIRDHLDAIADLARRNHVQRLYLFGSAVRDDFDPRGSDLDFAVDFKPDAPRLGFEGPYFKLLFGLKKLFNREVDLVQRSAIRNPYFREELEETEVLIYEA